MLYEDWQNKYEEILNIYKLEKMKTSEMQENLIENQMRYIKREGEYKEVINHIENKI